MRSAIGSTALVLGVVLAAFGCGDEPDEDPTTARGETLTVYASLPAHGVSARAGDAAALGMRRALADAGGDAAGRPVRLVRLDSTRPGDEVWDPGTVEANAQRAVEDPSTVAYLGELDLGGSAVSLPVTNERGILQISPADGLTSLTRSPIGRPRGGPERYYAKGEESFVRLVPPDSVAARQIVDAIHGRRISVVHGGGNSNREFEGMVGSLAAARGKRITSHGPLREDPEDIDKLALEVAADRPQAVVLAVTAGRAASKLLAALGRELPDVPVYGGPQLAAATPAGLSPRLVEAVTGVLPATARPRAAQRLLDRLGRDAGRPVGPEALLGYEAMRVALEAVDEAGLSRPGIVQAALSTRTANGILGSYEVRPTGDVNGLGTQVVELVRR